jgi:cytidine diphosphoramidate kinase
MVLWLIGLSGSGKTTISKEILKKIGRTVKFIHIDGDEFRNFFSKDLGFSLKDRKINAERISQLVSFLSRNKLNVIVSVLSNYPEWLKWNRKNIINYREFFIKTDLNTLFKRNKKNLYLSKKINVVGKDIKFIEPQNSDFIFYNDFKKDSIKKISNKIISFIPKKHFKKK